MNIDQWWPRLDTTTQEWLIEHNGEPLSADALRAIVAAGGEADAGARATAEMDPDGHYLTDENVDWIEAAANGEFPAADEPG